MVNIVFMVKYAFKGCDALVSSLESLFVEIILFLYHANNDRIGRSLQLCRLILKNQSYSYADSYVWPAYVTENSFNPVGIRRESQKLFYKQN